MTDSRYMLDTNTISHSWRQHPNVARHVVAVSTASLCISALTAGELLYGLAKRPDAVRLQAAVTEFMRRIEILQWDFSTADRYGNLRAALDRTGRSLESLDLLIARARPGDRVHETVTNDRAFSQITQSRSKIGQLHDRELAGARHAIGSQSAPGSPRGQSCLWWALHQLAAGNDDRCSANPEPR